MKRVVAPYYRGISDHLHTAKLRMQGVCFSVSLESFFLL